MTLTDALRDRLRRKIGDTGDSPAFTDAELDDIYDEAGDSWNKAVLYAYDELLASAAKLNDYTAGESSEKRSQIYSNLSKFRDRWAQRVADDKRKANQVKFTSVKSAPPKRKDKPRDMSLYRRKDEPRHDA